MLVGALCAGPEGYTGFTPGLGISIFFFDYHLLLKLFPPIGLAFLGYICGVGGSHTSGSFYLLSTIPYEFLGLTYI